MKKLLAFSLIELMISLITISCIVAAFTPVITKKLKTSNVTISGNNVSDITTECSDKFSSNCKLCTKSYCIQCELNSCPIGQYAENKSCSCKDCSTLHSNCSECDSTKCTKCKDNNYYINNGKCENCPANKICDGINAYDESYCTNPPNGYFCDGNNIRKCSDKYSSYCSTCNSSGCISCQSGYYISNKDCKPCAAHCRKCQDSSYCLTCSSYMIMDTTTHSCTRYCYSAIENCYYCSDANTCTRCYSGFYINSSNKCSPCSEIPNCTNCSDKTTCLYCKKGYYVNSSKGCSICSINNCAQCGADGSCLSCNQGYHLSEDKNSCIGDDNKFNCSDSNFMKIGNLCVTRLNMGDSNTLTIPSTVTVVKAGSEYCYSQSAKCCWKGTTSSNCNSNNGSYDGCTRTVCNYSAAEEICAKFNYAGKAWRLATKIEAENWAYLTFSLGNNGLMLCSSDNADYVTLCNDPIYCKGANKDICLARYVWYAGESNELIARAYSIGQGLWSEGSVVNSISGSVRCVTEME